MNASLPAENQRLSRAVLRIDVTDHAGVMSHVVGLFSRRACNVEAILCLPAGDGRHSRIWLQVEDNPRLPAMIRQVEKLIDVQSVARCDAGIFERLSGLVAG